MKVLSLYDGMACGMIALKELHLPVERYVAYEIDKYAIKTAKHNFPEIEECGDVFHADFSQYIDFDLAMGGSPCTSWSIARGNNNREIQASGTGWELFNQFTRMLKESKPKYFIYENNKSMSKNIRSSIRQAFGFEEICIDSALVSAQHRERYYWIGKRMCDGTYKKVNIPQPKDKNMLLCDILGNSYANIKQTKPVRIGTYPNLAKNQLCDSKQYRIYSIYAKSVTLCGQGGGMGAKTGLYAIPNECGYQVKDKYITINNNTIPINIADGYYEIRKLNIQECKKLQTVPNWYTFPVSDTQAYKMLGNGWTINVIKHLINFFTKSIDNHTIL